MSVERASHQQYLGIYLDKKSNFKMHIETVLCKINKGISIIKKLRHTLHVWKKAFLKPHIDYGDIVYDQPSMNLFVKN